jgi:hypothetical protein
MRRTHGQDVPNLPGLPVASGRFVGLRGKRQVVGGYDEPVLGSLQPIELLEGVAPDPLHLKSLWECRNAVRRGVVPRPGLHPQRVGVLLTPFARHRRLRGVGLGVCAPVWM